jgi:large-conductance mechanosensitive channel, mscL
VINFIIVAIAIFIVVKILNSAKDKMVKQEEKKEEKPK